MALKNSAKKEARKTNGTRTDGHADGKFSGKSYNAFKEYKGQRYTGMAVGRSHKWNYDKGIWKETKVTPDRWELTYDVIKRRAGHAPEGSGVPVGTAYHWFILSHQYVEKLNANDYTTSMVGLKFKLAHKRADKDKWSVSDATQYKNLIRLLEDFIAELKSDPAKTMPVPLNFQYRGKEYKGVGIPVISSCDKGICHQLDITLNKKHLGVLKCMKNGWRLTDAAQGLANAIGEEVFHWYE
ncbi:MAG TPA: hypothetical protein VIN08_25045 [Ohtaekwangia sp.]|uniref:hypothetical protein n=1 Tax=Ohtaekwangia sp. TaxID=2066019 RepID=UPI002F95C1FC